MRPSRAPRVARGAVAASVATFVALLAHVAAGGVMPGWLGVVVPWLLSLMVCIVLAGRRLSLLRLAGAVVVSQAMFHVLFVLGTVSAEIPPAVSTGGHEHGVPAMSLGAGDAAVMSHADGSMWLLHGVAALVTVAALYRGERAVQRLREIAVEWTTWLRRRIVIPVTVPFLSPVSRLARISSDGWQVASAPRASLPLRRGPPSLRVL